MDELFDPLIVHQEIPNSEKMQKEVHDQLEFD